MNTTTVMPEISSLDQFTNGGIFPRLDYLTLIFHNVSINFVLNFIHCSDMQEDLVKNEYDRNYGNKTWVSFPLLNSGVKVEVRREHFEKYSGLSVFDRQANYVRLDISGSGLDFLRSKDIDVEFFFRSSIPLMADGTPLYHVTRCDIAFDLVNYCPEFMAAFSMHVRGTDNGSVHVRGCNRPLTFSEKYATKEHTFYLGAKSSDRMLRVYDKAFEYQKNKKKRYDLESLFPVESVDSWIRFELQCRNSTAQHFLLDFPDYTSVYMWMYDYFAPVTSDQTVADFWFNIWRPAHVPYVIQNLQFVHSVITKEDLIRKVGNNVDLLSLYFADREFFHVLMCKGFDHLIHDDSSYGSNKRLKFYRNLSLFSDGEDGNINWHALKNVKKVVSGNKSILIPVFD